MKRPEIRFEGFDEEWERRKLSDVVDVYSGMDYKHLSEGDIPVYGTGGYMLSVDKALSYDKDAVGIGRKGTIDKPYILKAPFWTVDTLFYAIPKNEECLDFVYDIFQSVDWKKKDESTGVPSLSKVAINDTDVMVPSEDEQKLIGAYFDKLDNLITLHQRKLDTLQNLKKSMLEKMFPKEGETKPEIRFEGFTDEWDKHKLSDIYVIIRNAFVGTASPYYVDEGHFYLESNNVKDGNINKDSQVFINDEFYYRQKDKWLHTGDMVMVQSGHVGHSAVIPESLNNTAAHALIMFQNQRVKTNPCFLNAEYQTNKAKKQIDDITKGNTIKHILASDMRNFTVMVPSLSEQNEIADYFRSIDHLLTLHQHKLESLKHLKSALLDKMFV